MAFSQSLIHNWGTRCEFHEVLNGTSITHLCAFLARLVEFPFVHPCVRITRAPHSVSKNLNVQSTHDILFVLASLALALRFPRLADALNDEPRRLPTQQQLHQTLESQRRFQTASTLQLALFRAGWFGLRRGPEAARHQRPWFLYRPMAIQVSKRRFSIKSVSLLYFTICEFSR